MTKNIVEYFQRKSSLARSPQPIADSSLARSPQPIADSANLIQMAFGRKIRGTAVL